MKKAIVIAVAGLALASAAAYAQMQHGPGDMRQGEHMMGGMPMMRGAMMRGGIARGRPDRHGPISSTRATYSPPSAAAGIVRSPAADLAGPISL